MQDAAGGALAADATLVAPGTGAFAIWTLIYLGLLAYAVWQFLPAQRTAARHRRLGYPIAASLLLNGAWILSVQFDRLGLSVPIIVALLVVLVVAFRTCLALPAQEPARHHRDRRHGGPLPRLGDHRDRREHRRRARRLGLGRLGHPARDVGRPRRRARRARGHRARGVGPRPHRAHAVAGWGLAWIAVARLTDAPASTVVGITAIIAVVAIVLVTVGGAGRRSSFGTVTPRTRRRTERQPASCLRLRPHRTAEPASRSRTSDPTARHQCP